MITRFFSTSKPIHFVIIAFVTFIVFMGSRIYQINEDLSLGFVLKQSVIYVLVLTSLFVLDFLVSKNHLTKKNNYKLKFIFSNNKITSIKTLLLIIKIFNTILYLNRLIINEN